MLSRMFSIRRSDARRRSSPRSGGACSAFGCRVSGTSGSFGRLTFGLFILLYLDHLISCASSEVVRVVRSQTLLGNLTQSLPKTFRFAGTEATVCVHPV